MWALFFFAHSSGTVHKLLCQEELGYLGYRWLLAMVGTGHTQKQALSNAPLVPGQQQEWTVQLTRGFVLVAHLCSHYRDGRVLSASGHTFKFQNLVPNITLWSPNLAATGFFHIILLTLHSFMLLEGLAREVVPHHLPPTRKCYVTKRNEYKICIFKLSFNSENDLLRDHVCFKLLVTGNVGLCLALSLCKIPPLPFSGLA